MPVIGVICEYNPFHNGHSKQLRRIRQHYGPDCTVVCLMSGNFVQRGHPAIVDKSLRARAAAACGADLVLEMPATVSLRSAEGFAQGSVEILAGFCDVLCFGAETGNREDLLATARALLSDRFPVALRQFLDAGLSFPSARARALESMGLGARLLANPNDTLAVEYCKAILSRESGMDIFPICREGGYHDTVPDLENPSATFLRDLLTAGEDIAPYVSEAALCQQSGTLHSLHFGERAILAQLRTMSDERFSSLPYGSEGLWRKLMRESRRQATLEDILAAVKSKRYTRTRLDRMVMCAFLGLTQEDLAASAPYIRVLAMTSRGQQLLKPARRHISILNPGEASELPYWQLEQRLGALYGLFSQHPELPEAEKKRRIFRCP